MAPRYSTANASPLVAARSCIGEATSATSANGEQAIRSTVILPASILDRSRTSVRVMA